MICLLATNGLKAQNQFTTLLEVDSCANWIRASFNQPIDQTQTNFILLYQHRGATIQTADNANFGALVNLNGTGRFEVNRIGVVNGDTLFLLDRIQHAYLTQNAATMVVLQTDLNGLPVTQDLTAPTYNGTIGGILFLPSSDELEIDANLNAAGAGYPGGATSIRNSQCGAFTNANDYFYPESDWRGTYKGQSLTFPSALNGREMGRGRNLSGGGGGNDHNAGGGGGGNDGAGGQGAQNEEPGFFNCSGNFPGLGGANLRSVPNYNQRIFLGGGGGAGHGNNNNPTAGGNGGGIVFLYANKVTFQAALINASGTDAAEVDGDGGGGGGAGGSLVILADSLAGDATLNVEGGRGADVENSGQNRCFGPGGGGGGGRLLFPLAWAADSSFDLRNSGGQGGTSLNSTACPNNSNQGVSGEPGTMAPLELERPVTIQLANGQPDFYDSGQLICSGQPFLFISPNAVDCLAGAYFLRTGPGEEGLVLLQEFDSSGVPPYQITPTDQDSLVIVFRQYLTGNTVAIESTSVFDVTTGPTASFTSEVVENSFMVTGLVIDNVDAFSWDFGDGSSSDILQPSHVYTAPGTYTACFSFSNACGADQLCTQVVIAAPASFIDISTAAVTYCAGDTIFLLNNSQNVSNLNWTLTPANGTFFPSSASENPFVIISAAGNYTIGLTATSNLGEELNATTAVEINALPAYVLTRATDNFTVTFTSNGGNSDQLTWEILGEEFTNQPTVTYTFPGPGTYQANFSATNACGTLIDSVTVTLFSSVNAVVTTPISTGCAPLTATIFNESSGDFTSVEWRVRRLIGMDSLDFTGAEVLGSSNDTLRLRFDTAGFYEVQLLISGPGGIDSVVQNFSISLPPIAMFTVAESGGLIQLTNLSTNASAYFWNFGDGNTSTQFEPIHQYLTPGTYNINLNATNAACGRASSQTIIVNQIVTVTDPFDAQISVAPNPGNGRFIFDSPAATYEVFDLQGRHLLLPTHKTAGQVELDLFNQPAGVYVLIISANKQRYVRRLIKE